MNGTIDYGSVYEAILADNRQMKTYIAELEAGIKAMYQIDQSQDSRMDTYARGHNDGVDFARTEQTKMLELRMEELVAENATQAAHAKEMHRAIFAQAAELDRLRAEPAEAKRWVPAPDGQIPESNLWIVSAHGDGWFLEFGKNGAKVWFPGVVRLYVDSTQIKIEESTQ